MTLSRSRHDGNRNEVGCFQSQNCKTKFSINSTPKHSQSQSAKTAEKQARYIFEELFGNNTSPRVDRQLHFTDLLVDFFHKVNDKVYQLMFVHLLRVEVGDEKADIVALQKKKKKKSLKVKCASVTDNKEPLKIIRHWEDIGPLRPDMSLLNNACEMSETNKSSKATALTSTGFLLKMKKFSALIIMKRMNL